MNREYPYIDWFRLPAALMVIAIHTAPFFDLNPGLDVIVTYGIGRIAVPFFLMTAGYFVLAPYVNGGFADGRRYRQYLKKIGLFYGAAVLLYLPVMWYAGKLPSGLWETVKMLVFDGTFYHLWYFPALLTGSVLLIGLLKKYSERTVLTVSVLLYIAGVFGDSYYGAAAEIPGVRLIYEAIFCVSSYTRNGIFYVPVFLLLGILLTKEKYRCKRNRCRYGAAAGLLVMAMESYVTHSLFLKRHDSMYLSLPIVMYFLYQLLLKPGRKAPEFLRRGTAFLYVIHPIGIILARRLAAVWNPVLAENSAVHYGMVCFVSLCMTAGYLYLDGRRTAYVRKRQSLD